MRSAVLRIDEEQLTEDYPQKRLDEFTQELTALCQRYGLGIAGSPTLFVMEPVDRDLTYKVDEKSNLIFG